MTESSKIKRIIASDDPSVDTSEYSKGTVRDPIKMDVNPLALERGESSGEDVAFEAQKQLEEALKYIDDVEVLNALTTVLKGLKEKQEGSPFSGKGGMDSPATEKDIAAAVNATKVPVEGKGFRKLF